MVGRPHEHYLLDLGSELKSQALQAKNNALSAFQSPNEDYHLGRVDAYFTVLSLMQDQAEVFGIDAADIGLSDFDVDHELLIKRKPT